MSASSTPIVKTKVPTGYTPSPNLQLKGDWLIEAGFGAGTFVTVKVTEGCLVLIADNSEEQQLREQLIQMQQTVSGIKAVCLAN